MQPMESEGEYKAYGYRWFILAMFCMLELANNMLWVTFAPISDITSNYFGGSGYYASSTSVNMLANIFLITYLPGTALSIFMMKYFNLRKALAISGFLTMFGALLRYVAAANFNEWGVRNTYIVMMLGQLLAGIGQPMLLNSPPAVASIWFPTSEREIATTIGSMFSPIGSAVGQIIPFLLVSQTSQNRKFMLYLPFMSCKMRFCDFEWAYEVQNIFLPKSYTSFHLGFSLHLLTAASAPPLHSLLLPTANDDDDFTVHGMSDLMLAEFILCIVPFSLCVFFFKDKPPTAPSKSTKLKIDVSAICCLVVVCCGWLCSFLFSRGVYREVFVPYDVLRDFYPH